MWPLEDTSTVPRAQYVAARGHLDGATSAVCGRSRTPRRCPPPDGAVPTGNRPLGDATYMTTRRRMSLDDDVTIATWVPHLWCGSTPSRRCKIPTNCRRRPLPPSVVSCQCGTRGVCCGAACHFRRAVRHATHHDRGSTTLEYQFKKVCFVFRVVGATKGAHFLRNVRVKLVTKLALVATCGVCGGAACHFRRVVTTRSATPAAKQRRCRIYSRGALCYEWWAPPKGRRLCEMCV